MNRRDTIAALLALGATGGPLCDLAKAQPARKPYRIALLPDFPPPGEFLLKLFGETLRGLGRIEGRDFVFYRSGIFPGPETDPAVKAVVDAKPDLIFAANLGYVIAAHKLTKTIPIVMWVSGFPVEGGVAASLAHPAKNVTGLTIYAGAQVFGKLVQLLRDVKPGIRRIGAMCTYVPPFHPPEEAEPIIREIQEAGRALGIDVRIIEVAKSEQTADALARIVAERMEALVLTSGVSTRLRRAEIMQFAVEKRLPTITDAAWLGIEPQPMLTYATPLSGLIALATTYVDKILWGGAKPGDLPIQLPAKIDLTVNLKTAKALGLTIPPLILGRADSVIE
ncbi:MAG TPA: ABC transporter substrate-binding protein [Burkholderiales bacterium]|nr:ABC transporter substrate-binding protein [Burkholderiales bacterium]